MAPRALVDTTVLYATGTRYAAGNRSERSRHEEGLAIVKAADRGEIPTLLITDAVWIETMNGLHRDVGHEKATEMARRFQAGDSFDLLREPKAVWEQGSQRFENREHRPMGEALQLASARHHESGSIYSFDARFDAFDDLGRLASPVEPVEPG